MSISVRLEIVEGVSTSGAETVGGVMLVGAGVTWNRVAVATCGGSVLSARTVGVFMIGDRLGMGDILVVV